MAHNLGENLLVGIGHPLLDITTTVNKGFLLKHNLKENDAIIANDCHRDLYSEILEKYPVTYTVGGSIQNTLRIMQWIIEKPNVTTFFGTVGRDELSKILFEKATLDGVNVRYHYTDKDITGTCIVLITEKNRSLCTNPGASRLFDIEHLNIDVNKKILDTAKYYYMGGFFLTVNPEALLEVSKLAVSRKREFLFNISAPYICHKYKNYLLQLMPYFDIVFGNKSEIEALGVAFGLATINITEILLALAKWSKIVDTKPRMIVLTQGENPVLIAIKNVIFEFPVPKLENVKIVDTNGAGDAFVGGFLSQYIQGNDLKVCVKCGLWAALEIIQKVGCTYEGKASFHV